MCVICAAVPAVVAVGTAADGKQRQRQNEAVQHGELKVRPQYPIRALTALAILALFLGSAIYHIFQPSN